jgi:hypothetical protein
MENGEWRMESAELAPKREIPGGRGRKFLLGGVTCCTAGEAFSILHSPFSTAILYLHSCSRGAEWRILTGEWRILEWRFIPYCAMSDPVS